MKGNGVLSRPSPLWLLLPPTPRMVDKLVFLYCLLLTALLVLPLSLIRRQGIKDSLYLLFPRLMPRDLLVQFAGCQFLARRGKMDIMLLNRLSEPWMKDYVSPVEERRQRE